MIKLFPFKFLARAFVGLGLALLAFSSCIPRFRQVREPVPENLYRDVSTQDTATLAVIPWRDIFTDADLQSLIEEGIKNNLDLKIAATRIEQASANLMQSRLALLPSLNAGATAEFQKQPVTGKEIRVYGVDVNSGWEIDLWGRLKSAKRADLMALKQSEAYRRAVQTQIIAGIAESYYTLLALDAQLSITEQTVEILKEDVKSMNALKESNVVTGAAVVQSSANRYSAEVTIPALKQNIRETENALSVLIGRVPGSIQRSVLDSQKIAVDLKTGLPAQLLAYRPDVQAAEFQLRYFAELTHAARASFYPALTITAQAGFSNSDLAKVFNPSSFFGNILGGLTQPLLNKGLNRQRLRIAKAQQEESLNMFKQTLLNAGQEVSDALYAYQSASERIDLRTQQIMYLKKAVEYTKELLKYTSATNYTDVLTSEQGLLSAQLNSVNDKLRQFQALIKLYRSLGGGTR